MTIKLRPATATNSITADDIHVRAGGTSSAEVSLQDTDVVQLAFNETSTSVQLEKNFQQMHGTFSMVTGDYFNTTGYIESFLGGSLGSITVNTIASSNDGGFYLGGSTIEGRITELTANTTSSSNTGQEIFFFKYVNNSDDSEIATSNVGWSGLTIRVNNFGDAGGSADVERLKNHYASFNSSSKKWIWLKKAGNQNVLGTSSGLTRYLQLD